MPGFQWGVLPIARMILSPSLRIGVRLDTYEGARDVADSGRMVFRMTSSNAPMPPSGNLPDPIIASIMEWIEDGLLEN